MPPTAQVTVGNVLKAMIPHQFTEIVHAMFTTSQRATRFDPSVISGEALLFSASAITLAAEFVFDLIFDKKNIKF